MQHYPACKEVKISVPITTALNDNFCDTFQGLGKVRLDISCHDAHEILHLMMHMKYQYTKLYLVS